MIPNLVRSPLVYASVVGTLGLLALLQFGRNTNAKGTLPSGTATGPVLVELFTSEGCSSCPPADALLKHLSEQQPADGIRIVALEEHVDYWNHLGWADPFSSSEFSERQNAYAETFGRDGVYTPQMVVDGQFEFVGSRSGAARDAIRKAAAEPKLNVALTLSGSATTEAPVVDIQISNASGVVPHGESMLWLAITEKNLQSDVKAGENSGELLKHADVVRSLRKVTALPVPINYKAQVKLSLNSKWNRDSLTAVAFVAEQESRRIIGAGTVALHR